MFVSTCFVTASLHCSPSKLSAAMHILLSQAEDPTALHDPSEMRADTSRPAPTLYKDASTAAAYAIMRMPACYAVIAKVLHELRTCLPDFVPASMLDFGAGPGTATWAAREVRPDPAHCRLSSQKQLWKAQ